MVSLLEFSLFISAAVAFAPASNSAVKTTHLYHHKPLGEASQLKIYREKVDWETGEVEICTPDYTEETPNEYMGKVATYAEFRDESNGLGLPLPPIFAGVGLAVAAGAVALNGDASAAAFAAPALLGAGVFAAKELKSVPTTFQGSEPALEAAFAKHATPAMKQVRSDVAQIRYFDEAHLYGALAELGLAGLGPDPPQLEVCELSGGGPADADEITLTLEFSSPDCPYKLWEALDRRGKLARFFGGAAEAEQLGGDRVCVRLSVMKPPAAAPAAPATADAEKPAVASR